MEFSMKLSTVDKKDKRGLSFMDISFSFYPC